MAQMMEIEPLQPGDLDKQNAKIITSGFEIRGRLRSDITRLIDGTARRHFLRIAGARLRLRPHPSILGNAIIQVNNRFAFQPELKLGGRIVAEYSAARIVPEMLKLSCPSVGVKAEPVCL